MILYFPTSVHYARVNVAFTTTIVYQLLAFELKSDSVAEEPFGRKEKNDPDRVFFPLTFYQCAVEYLQKKKVLQSNT